jgi:hypothetical protein
MHFRCCGEEEFSALAKNKPPVPWFVAVGLIFILVELSLPLV